MGTAHIIVPVADIYREHTFTSEVITQALMYEKVTILDTYDNWSKIEQWDEYQGWINNFYLEALCTIHPNTQYTEGSGAGKTIAKDIDNNVIELDESKINAEVILSSEFNQYLGLFDHNTVAIIISQSGETADTYAAIQEAKRRGAMTLGAVNVEGSTISRDTDAGVYLRVGPEIGVASTKAFIGQLAVLTMLAT